MALTRWTFVGKVVSLLLNMLSRWVITFNQGKWEVVKQEMPRVNIDILRISELKWMGMGKFSSDDLYIYYCGQNPLEEME